MSSPLLLLAGSLLAAAATPHTLSLTPAVVTLRGTGGQSTVQTLTVTNANDSEMSFELAAKDVVMRDGRREFVDPVEVPASIAASAIFSTPYVTVPAGASRSVRVTLTLPAAVAHRAVVVLFRAATKVPYGQSAALVSLGTLMTFTLSDRVSIAASDLRVQPQSPAANLALAESMTNDGDEPAVAKGIAVILDDNKSVVGKATFAPHRLLPGEAATFTTEYAGELPAGHYRVLSTFEFEGRTVTRSAEVVIS
jgi:hypothetical protein